MKSEKILTIEINGEIFHFSLFILRKKFHDWYPEDRVQLFPKAENHWNSNELN